MQILTKSLTAAVLNAIGDLIAQFYVEKKDKLDVGRLIRFAGLVSHCCAHHSLNPPARMYRFTRHRLVCGMRDSGPRIHGMGQCTPLRTRHVPSGVTPGGHSLCQESPLPQPWSHSLLAAAQGLVMIRPVLHSKPSAMTMPHSLPPVAQGFLMIGPVLHYWYGLNTRIAPGAGTGAALIRLAMDQLLFAPPFVALNFATLKCLEVSS